MRLGGALTVVSLACAACVACGRYGFHGGADGGVPADADVPLPPDFTDGSRLQAYVADDGNGHAQLVDWYDTLLAEHCTFEIAADGVLRCLPYLATSPIYGQADCTQPLAVVASGDDASCGRTELFARGNGKPVHMFALGAPWTQPTYAFVGSPLTCGAINYSDPIDALGPEIAPTMFVGATEQLVPHGRLSAVDWVADDGATQLTDAFVDGALATRCTLAELEPDTSYCVPDDTSTTFTILAYADAALTQEVVVAEVPVTMPRAIVDKPTICRNNPRIVTLGAETTEPLYMPSPTGVMTFVPTSYDHAYPVLAETGIDALDALALAVDPSTTRLAAVHWRDPDGNGATAGLWDSVRGGRCAPAVDDGLAALVCHLVPGPYFTQYYSDAACSVTSVEGMPMCRDATAGVEFPSLAMPPYTCDGQRLDFASYDGAVPPATVMFAAQTDGTCTQVDLVATPVIQADRAFFDASSLVPLRHEVD